MALAHQTDKYRAMQANPALMAEARARIAAPPESQAPRVPKDHGILMRPELARKSHFGQKTNTRRLCTVPAPAGATSAAVISSRDEHNGEWSWMSGDPKDADTWTILGDDFRCPFGVPGDRLWIREEHYSHGVWTPGCGWTKSGDDRWVFLHTEGMPTLFELPPEGVLPNHPRQHGRRGYYKRSSMFMSRSQCRTVAEITEVWLERLQEISQEDVFREGFKNADQDEIQRKTGRTMSSQECFRWYWEQLHGVASWIANPWVWSIHYEKINT